MMKMSPSGPFCHGGIRAPQRVPPEVSGNLQKLEVGGAMSSNNNKMQMSSADTELIVPEDGGLEVDNTSSSSSVGSSALKCKVSSVFSCLSITPDDRTLVLDEQDASLIPQKKGLREKSMLFHPNPTKSHTVTPGKLESPMKREEWRDLDFQIKQDAAIPTWQGNSSVHHAICQEKKGDTPSESPLSIVDSSAKTSEFTNSLLLELARGEEKNSTDKNTHEDICVRGERLKDLRARGMPDYNSWDVNALRVRVQRLSA